MEVIYKIIDGSSQVCFSIGMKAIIKTYTHTHTQAKKGGKRIKVKFPVSILVNLVLRAWSAA